LTTALRWMPDLAARTDRGYAASTATPGYAMGEILIADDHPLFREALKGAVAAALPGATIREARDVGSLLALTDDHPQAELLLLDLNMPGANGFSALVHVLASCPGLPVVVVSAREDADTVRGRFHPQERRRADPGRRAAHHPRRRHLGATGSPARRDAGTGGSAAGAAPG
jgi:CheY-like chemotaxis protein